MGSLLVVEAQEALKRGLEPGRAGGVAPPELDPPVLVPDRPPETLDEPFVQACCQTRPTPLSLPM